MITTKYNNEDLESVSEKNRTIERAIEKQQIVIT